MPTKETGKPSSEGSAPPCEQPGTSRDAGEPAGQNLSCKENSRVTVASQPKKVSYSTELFSTWRDIRWFQIPLSSLRRPKAGLFSFRFQSSLQEYQQLRKTKRLKVGRPFSVLPFPNLSVTLSDCSQETLYKQHGKHSGTGRVNSCKSSSACGAAPAASVPARPQRCHQPRRQCLANWPTPETCDCEDRPLATAQRPLVGASGRYCPGHTCVVFHRTLFNRWDCCPWNKMSPVSLGPQQSSHRCKHHRPATLHAGDICGSENSSVAKAKTPPGASAGQENRLFPERGARRPSSMQPHVLLHRLCLAQVGCETASQGWDEFRLHAQQWCAEEPAPMLPRVLLHRICLGQARREKAPQDRGGNRPQTEALVAMQPRVLLHRIPLVRGQHRTALENQDEARPCDHQSCAEERIPMQPRVVLRRVCLDQCRTAAKDRDGVRRRENRPCPEEPSPKQPCVALRQVGLEQEEAGSEDRGELGRPDSQAGAEELIPMQPRVLLRRLCVAQVQCEMVPPDREEPRPDHQVGAEEPVGVPEELSSSTHPGEYEAEPKEADLAVEQPFCFPPAACNSSPSPCPESQAKEESPPAPLETWFDPFAPGQLEAGHQTITHEPGSQHAVCPPAPQN